MDDPIWTFTRRDECLTISRQRTPDGLSLVVIDNGRPQEYVFNDISPLTTFQMGLEAALVRSGWSFVAFSPERRSATERRRQRLDSPEQREDRLRHGAGDRFGAAGELEADVSGRRKV